MDERTHRQLLRDTEELRGIVARSSTEHVVGWCSAFMLKRGSSLDEPSSLMSPVRQVFFLLGLTLTTEEPEEPESLDEHTWKRAIDLLNSVFSYYAGMFWPVDEEEVTDEWRGVREVAMPAFLHYFNVSLLASVEQMRVRFEKYVAPFDDVLAEEWGISGSEVLRIVVWMGTQLQGTVDDLVAAFAEEQAARWELLDLAAKEAWDEERLRKEAQKESYMPLMERVLSGLFSVAKVERAAVEEEFGREASDRFWDLVVSRRGGYSLQYITEQNPAESRPLFEVEEGVAMCPSYNALHYALLDVGERTVLASASGRSFLKHRDRTLEGEAREEFERILGEGAEYWSEVYETADLHYEHDIVIRWGNTLFAVEAKASPPVEPFRDPDKAFTRIERAFRSDRGIQKGFEQADRIRQRLAAGETVELFAGDRQFLVALNPDEIEEVYTICVTRDDFGVLALDLSLLLQKRDETPYPWAVNILDLNALADTYEYFDWGGERFVAYMEERRQVHGKLLATDELEVAGFSIEHGSLRFLIDHEAEKCHLRPSYSDVFDRVYEARRGGEPVVYDPTEPYAADLREMFREMMRENSGVLAPTQPETIRRVSRQGRNERCACGSGKKYKYCCGRSTS